MSGGFSYWVSDEQIAVYSSLPIDRRVRWVEEMARTTYALASPAVRARWASLRRGEPIGWRADLPEEDAAPERDEEFSRPYLPEPHYVLSAVFHGRERTLAVWAALFERVWDRDPIRALPPMSAPRRLLSWLDENEGGAFDGEPLVLHEVTALIGCMRAHPSCRDGIDEAFAAEVESFATKLMDYLVCVSEAQVPVRVTYV